MLAFPIYSEFTRTAMQGIAALACLCRPIAKVILCVLILLLPAIASKAQTITNGDGTPLTIQYCYADQYFELKGQPAGGTFSGCGISTTGGRWYLNPVAATENATVFPVQCAISYTVNNATARKTILIHKPVKTDPPLSDLQTCDGRFLLTAHMLYAGAYDYSWQPAQYLERPDTSITMGHIETHTTFVLTAIDHVSGCAGSDTITVFKRPYPEVRISPAEKTIVSRERVQLQAEGAQSYTWIAAWWLNSDRIANPVAEPQTSITYIVAGRNEYGCADTARSVIKVMDRLFVPNAFSPNNDGVNDVFRIENFGYQRVEEFRIFDRWGRVVFETRDGLKGWDGTMGGQYADGGTYFYSIGIRMPDGDLKRLKGDVQLIR